MAAEPARGSLAGSAAEQPRSGAQANRYANRIPTHESGAPAMRMSHTTFVRSNRMRSHNPNLRSYVERILERDGSMAQPPIPTGLSNNDQVAVLLELLASVDENAHNRAMAEAGKGTVAYLRTEEWEGISDDEEPRSLIASIDILEGELVVITYEMLSQLLTEIGFVKKEAAR